MPIDFKTGITNSSPLERAARKRVLDEGTQDLTEEQIKLRINQYLGLQDKRTIPELRSGEVLSSHPHREFLRDAKFFVHMNNSQLVDLDKEIRNASAQGWGMLAEIQQEASTLNSQISEEEIKLLGNYDKVHFNAFVRQLDMGVDYSNKSWLIDYKTQYAFLVNNIANIIPGGGITLPIRQSVPIPITDAVLIGEETDVGDSRWPVVQNSPRNVFLPDRVWRYLVIRREHDKTSRVYNYTPTYVTLQLEFPNLQLINYLNIKPVSQRGFSIEELSFVNEAGENVLMDTVSANVETNQILLFEPVRTRYLKLKLRGQAPITKTSYNVVDWTTKELNDVLRGAGWSQLLSETNTHIQGRVFDFSIEHLSVGLNIYEPLGVFRSKPVPVTSPIGMALSERSESIRVVNNQRSYGVDFQLPNGIVLNEYYLGLHLEKPGGTVVLHDLIPIPDSYPIQREFMPMVGAQAKAKLFPDLLWNLDKVRVTSVVHDTDLVNLGLVVTTEVPHGFVDGDVIGVIGPAEYVGSGEYEIYDAEELSFKIAVSSLDSAYLLDEGTVPRPRVYKVESQQDPIVLYQENTALVVGVDYHISVDGGSTWYDRFPKGSEYLKALRSPHAGNFKVKLLNPTYDKFYWIEYRTLKNQFLSKDRSVRLRNGRVIFGNSLRNTKGTVSTVIISRAESPNPQITPIVLYYALKVREDVS